MTTLVVLKLLLLLVSVITGAALGLTIIAIVNPFRWRRAGALGVGATLIGLGGWWVGCLLIKVIQLLHTQGWT